MNKSQKLITLLDSGPVSNNTSIHDRVTQILRKEQLVHIRDDQIKSINVGRRGKSKILLIDVHQEISNDVKSLGQTLLNNLDDIENIVIRYEDNYVEL